MEKKEKWWCRAGIPNKVRNSWGVYDAYKHIRKRGWYGLGKPVSEKEFYSVIRGINRLLAEEVALGKTVRFPFGMGKLELRKYKAGAFMLDGKLKITYPIDWKNTHLLWEQDKEAYDKKILLRHENDWVYHVRYIKGGAKYGNKIFYQFAINTFIKKALSKNIQQGNIDTLWLESYNIPASEGFLTT